MRLFLITIVLLSEICLKAQNNIVPNPGFENGNHNTNQGGLSGCNYSTATNPINQFNIDVDDWDVAEHKIDKGSQQDPDWIDMTICSQNYLDNMCHHSSGYPNQPPTLPTNRFVHLESHYVKPFVTIFGKKIGDGYTHEAIRAVLKEKLQANTTYIFRIKFSAQTTITNQDGTESSTNFSTNNHLRIFFTTKGDKKWHKQTGSNQIYEPVTINKIRNAGTVNACTWVFEEAQFTTPDKINKKALDLGNIILYTESGGFVIDDIELFKKCPDQTLIQNKTYDNWFYSASGNPFPPLIERASNILKAGYNVGGSNVSVHLTTSFL